MRLDFLPEAAAELYEAAEQYESAGSFERSLEMEVLQRSSGLQAGGQRPGLGGPAPIAGDDSFTVHFFDGPVPETFSIRVVGSSRVCSAGLRGRFGSGIIRSMSTVELIHQKASALPAELQEEALHYVDYLLTRQSEGNEAGQWKRFAAEQLAAQYGDSDAIYERAEKLATIDAAAKR